MDKKQIIEDFKAYPKVCRLIAGWEKEIAMYQNIQLTNKEMSLNGEFDDHRSEREKLTQAMNQNQITKLRVERWLSLLSDDQRSVIEERLFSGNSWVATAMELNYSEKTCQRYLNAAIKTIQSCEII